MNPQYKIIIPQSACDHSRNYESEREFVRGYQNLKQALNNIDLFPDTALNNLYRVIERSYRACGYDFGLEEIRPHGY